MASHILPFMPSSGNYLKSNPSIQTPNCIKSFADVKETTEHLTTPVQAYGWLFPI